MSDPGLSVNRRRYRQSNEQEKGRTTFSKILITKQKTKDRIPRIPLINGDWLRCSRMVSISCYNNGTRRVALVTNMSINHAYGKRAYTICGHGDGTRSPSSPNQRCDFYIMSWLLWNVILILYILDFTWTSWFLLVIKKILHLCKRFTIFKYYKNVLKF